MSPPCPEETNSQEHRPPSSTQKPAPSVSHQLAAWAPPLLPCSPVHPSTDGPELMDHKGCQSLGSGSAPGKDGRLEATQATLVLLPDATHGTASSVNSRSPPCPTLPCSSRTPWLPPTSSSRPASSATPRQVMSLSHPRPHVLPSGWELGRDSNQKTSPLGRVRKVGPGHCILFWALAFQPSRAFSRYLGMAGWSQIVVRAVVGKDGG